MKLATLFLALNMVFSAVLLISRPVSADQMVNQSERTDNVGVLTDSDGYSTNEYRDREYGKQQGIDDGKNGYWPNVNRKEIPIPRGIDFEDEYRDGYEEGYSEGWHKEHPFQGAIFDVFVSIWGVVSGLFSEAN
ncbi:TPA: hypothetical protein VLL19_001295 [Streptococcus pyogenes]|uniref:hypothetical protein n=1 Tax=Streptococcus pyogenes TaxID=1314 RepID=UPI00109C8913|nr:hypothetical protein [Streptococcus pyogenes]HER5543665.1 hypothetical protein [Streptococcus pyogenes]HER5569649.1 hypothetical protein [Streptococcus pyogenes]HER6086425.1 hypothetical protein [Streptococcus pyogenes]HER6087668.1 hypothetical protein [Streptococcus pyogenes]HER6089739.1 hypothetical protein [Streptococcus pyogenes]